jgi:hypothetical protein
MRCDWVGTLYTAASGSLDRGLVGETGLGGKVVGEEAVEGRAGSGEFVLGNWKNYSLIRRSVRPSTAVGWAWSVDEVVVEEGHEWAWGEIVLLEMRAENSSLTDEEVMAVV